ESFLRPVAAQDDVPGGVLEIVLVDDRSDDGTANIARDTGLQGLEISRIDRYDSSSLPARQLALDAGIRRARGQIVLLTDADAIPAPGWIAAMCAPIERGAADVVAGGVEFAATGSAALAALQTVDA